MAMAGACVDVSAVAVGDFLHYDIKGANAAGNQSVLISSRVVGLK